jgi:hypothetical protein
MIALEQSDPDRVEERIRALQRRVYGRDPSPEDVTALAAALDRLRPDPPQPVLTGAGSAAPAAGESPADAAPLPAPGGLATWWALLATVPPRVLLTGVTVAVVAALAGAGALLLVERPASADADPVAARFTPAISVRADPAVLQRPAGSADRTTSLVGPDLVVGSFRRLAGYPAAGVSVWAARDRFGETCLVVADTYYRTACADATTAKATGLVLAWSSGPGYPPSTTESYTAVWRDGRLRAGPSTP